MLPKDKRIRATEDFTRVYKKGSFFPSKLLSGNALSNRTGTTRLGFVVGKKMSKKATERNKLKRQAREIARKLYDRAPKGYDIVVNIKKEAKDATPAELETEIRKLFQRIEKNEKNNSFRH